MSPRRRTIRRRAKRLYSYWRAEQRTLRQGLVALALSTVAGFIAGLTLAGIGGTLQRLPGLIVLIPAAVGMRGTIFGAIGARLGTTSAAGTFEVTRHKGSVLYQNVYVAVVSTLASSLWLAVLARLMCAVFGLASISLWDLITISVVGATLGSVAILLVTVGLSVTSYRKGWDLDSVSTPMVTALGDMVTIPTLFLATFLLNNQVVSTVACAICLAGALYAAYRAYAVDDRIVRRIILEMTAVILLTPILDVLSGLLQQNRLPELLAVPAVFAMLAPFVSQAGALGGIFASRTSSKLQIGVITPRGLPEIPALVDGAGVFVLGVAVFALIGTFAVVLTSLAGHGPDNPGTVIGATMVAGLIATPITIAVSYYLAIITFRFGLDPDNQTVPIITSAMDLAGVACVLFVMTSFGVLGHG